MVESAFEWAEQGDDFAQIQEKLAIQIVDNSAFIIVDVLNHLVKEDVCQMSCHLEGTLQYQTYSLL